MRVTVTGASGFVGRAVCDELQAHGWTVRGVVRVMPEAKVKWERVGCDLLTAGSVRRALDGADVVVHAAGLAHVPPHRQVEQQFIAVNADITERVGTAAAELGAHMVFISSEAAAAARTPYGRSKRIAEERLAQLGRERGLWWTALRPALLFGERDPGNFLRLMVAVARGRAAHLDGGRARKSLTYVRNVGPAVAALAKCGVARARAYSLADPRPYTVREIVETMSECLDVAPPRLSLPLPIARVIGFVGTAMSAAGLPFPLRLDTVDTLCRDAVVDTRPLQEEAGFFPPIPFREGVRRTVEWCRDARIIG